MAETNTVYDPDADEHPVHHDAPSDDELRRLTGINEEQESAMDRQAHNGAAADIAKREGLFNPAGDTTNSSAATAGELGAAEAGAATEGLLGAGFNPKDPKRGQSLKNFFWGSSLRKRSTIGGSIAGLLIGGGFFGLTLVSGPLEFVHIAQLLQQFHFSSMQDTQDNRLSKIARYIRDPSKPQNTRLGAVGNHIANGLEAKMNETGVESAYTQELGYFDGYIIDTSNSHFSDLEGMSEQEKIQALSDRLGVPAAAIKINDPARDGKISIDASKLGRGISGYRNTLKLNETMLKEAGYSKIAAAVGARIMGKRAGITWHPIQRADASLLQGGINALNTLRDQFRQAQAQEIDNRASPIEVSGNQETNNSKGQPDPNATDLNNQLEGTTAEAASANQGIKNGDSSSLAKYTDSIHAKLTGGGAAAVGVLCLLQGLGAHINELRLTQVILPMIRMGMEAITVGNQVMSGQDLSAQQLGLFKEELDKVDSKGNVLSTWNQARSIQHEEGQALTGPDIPNSAKVFNKANPFGFTSSIPGLSSACSVINNPVIGFVLSGGPIGFIVGYLTSNFAIGPIADSAAHWLAGAAIDPFAAGADRGNFMNYGARLAANDQAAAAGGVALSSGNEAGLKTADAAISKSQFQSQSLAYKIFNPYDSNSLVSHFIDQQDPNLSQNVSRVASGFGGIFGDVFKIPGTLFSSLVHADTTNDGYSYGFPAYGFSESDQTNSLVDNPFKNASVVADLLNGPNGQQYIDKASKCFGVTIAKDATNVWGVSGGGTVVNLYDDSYNPSDCADSSDPNWLRVRFFILDTETVESYACYQGDSQSCADVSFND